MSREILKKYGFFQKNFAGGRTGAQAVPYGPTPGASRHPLPGEGIGGAAAGDFWIAPTMRDVGHAFMRAAERINPFPTGQYGIRCRDRAAERSEFSNTMPRWQAYRDPLSSTVLHAGERIATALCASQ